MELEILKFDMNAQRRRVTDQTFDDVASAMKYVEETYKIVFHEEDSDYPNCVDIFTSSGDVIAIQPVNLKIHT